MNCTLQVTLLLQGPILTRSSAVGRHGVDAPVARDDRDRCILHGTHVRGLLRQSWTELSSIPAISAEFDGLAERWLGTGSDNESEVVEGRGVSPRRGSLHFDAFELRPAEFAPMDPEAAARLPLNAGQRSRIRIDPDRRAVAPQMLQSMEIPFGSGARIRATGVLRAFVADKAQAERLRQRIEDGLRWIPALGGERTIGFGRVLGADVSLHEVPANPVDPVSSNGDSDETEWELELDECGPLCHARHRIDANLFEGRSEIPGAAIRGALAERWRALLGTPARAAKSVLEFVDPPRRALAEHFDRLVFRDAFPTTGRERPTRPPESLVRVAGTTYDVANLDRAVLIRGQAPAFAVDWKADERGAVHQAFGWAAPSRELRVRTAIDSEARKADDRRLFAWETVHATTADRPPMPVRWLGQISLAGIPDPTVRREVARQLFALLGNRLDGLGKTKASARVRVRPALRPEIAGSGPWRVVLQTDALLADPRIQPGSGLHPSSGTAAGRLGTRSLLDAYRFTWDQISGGALVLSHFYARQHLEGGYYLWKRFQPDRPYNPWLLTDAGAVFLLTAATGRGDEARARLADWSSRGLRLPNWIDPSDDGSAWVRCPFVPQNGFGEIRVNPPMPSSVIQVPSVEVPHAEI